MKVKLLFQKISRRLNKEVKKVRNKVSPKINIPKLNYKTTSNSDVRICVVGLGPQGHKLALYLNQMGYNVAAICDLNKKRLSNLGSKIPNSKAINNIENLKELNIDICVLATLADSHLFLVKKIFSLGIKKILSEKPITNNISDGIELKNFVLKNKVRLEVYHPALFSEDYKNFKTSISSLDKGEFLSGKMFFKPGGIGNIGSHVFSTFLYLTNIRISRIEYAKLSEVDGTSRGNNFFDPNGEVVFKTSENKSIKVENSKSLGFRAQKILLEFENYFINFYDGKKITILNKKERNYDSEIVAKFPVNSHLGRYMCVDNAIKSLLQNENSISLDYALDAVELIIGSHSSFKNNKSVVFPLEKVTPKFYNFS